MWQPSALLSPGNKLAFVEGLPQANELIAKLRDDDPSAYAELHAIQLIASSDTTEIELFPEVTVGQRRRKVDFRARRTDPWVYVEVAATKKSELAKRAEAMAIALAESAQAIKKPAVIEVFLIRDPNESELAALRATITTFGTGDLPELELPDGLGRLTRHEERADIDLAGEVMATHESPVSNSAEPARLVMVRLPFSDQRAETFITSEAKQLPEDAPGLIMFEVTHSPNALQSWEPLLRDRLQPNMHTRVGAVCLFSAGVRSTDAGLARPSITKVLVNPYARLPLPAWVETTLTEAGAEFRRLFQPGAAPNAAGARQAAEMAEPAATPRP